MFNQAYAKIGDLTARYDSRAIGDLVSDQGSRQSVGDLASNGSVQAALDDAAGLINAACNVSERYTTNELNDLTGVNKALLIRINCDLAFGLLVQRRGNDPAKCVGYVSSMEYLEEIKDGKRIFASPADVAAGLEQINFPSLANYNQLNLVRDVSGRFFPVRRRQNTISN